MSKPTTINDFTFLSDEDVKLLYDIITTAEASSARPFQALFAAYDQVLAKYGIAKENDQIYFRFLLHMGEVRREGEGLFERFESLLSKLGLQIDFMEEGEEDSRQGEEQNDRSGARHAQGSKNNENSPLPTRRASFDSVYDASAETRRINSIKAPPTAPRPRSTDLVKKSKYERYDQQAKPPVAKSQRDIKQQNGGLTTTTRGRLKSAEVPQPSERESFRKIAVSRSKERPYRQEDHVPYMSGHLDIENASTASAEESDVEIASSPESEINAQLKPFSKALLIEPYIPQMESHAKTLRYHHLAANAVSIFRHWSQKANRYSHTRQSLLAAAAVRDAETLRHQAFDQWRIAYLQKQSIRQTELFFANLETKATRARDVFLLTKAFTHWAQTTADEITSKTVARKHLLQTRCLNAWREISVVNELKVRRQGLQKFMSLWKRRTARIVRNHEKTISFEERNCTDRFYRRWFWHFCERRAPTWYASKLKSSLFSKWADSARQAHIRNSWAIDFCSIQVLQTCYGKWEKGLETVEHNRNEAGMFRRLKLLRMPLESMHQELTYAPLQAQMLHAVDMRVVRSTLSTWVNRISNLSLAAQLNKTRTQRNAWTMWNDRLRSQTLSKRIDDRVVLQALYKWVLVERLALYLRIRQKKLRWAVFSTWKNNMDELSISLGRASYLARQSMQQRIRASIAKKWVAMARTGQQQHVVAQDYRAQHLLTDSMKCWILKLRHAQQLRQWSLDARFYVLTSGSIKRWQSASVMNKQIKRREAYSKLRRRTKAALASKLLAKWREAAKTLLDMQQKATSINHESLLNVGTTLFTTWHSRTLSLNQSQAQASALHDAHITHSYFTYLKTRYFDIRNAALRITTFLAESNVATTAGCLRKLNWQTFQLKRQAETASSLEERNRRKHHRNMVRYWSDRTRQRRQPTERVLFLPPSGSLTTWAVPIVVNDQENLQLQEAERSYPPTETTVTAPTMTPGYLRTPSRHSRTTFTTTNTTTTTNRIRLPPLPPPSFSHSHSHSSQQLQQRLTRAPRALSTPATTQFTPFLTRLREVETVSPQLPQTTQQQVRGRLGFFTGTTATRSRFRSGRRTGIKPSTSTLDEMRIGGRSDVDDPVLGDGGQRVDEQEVDDEAEDEQNHAGDDGGKEVGAKDEEEGGREAMVASPLSSR